jgi:hypothetical protein
MAAQISQFSNCIQRKMIKSFGEITGGSARALLQTRADYAALREPFYLSKLIAEYLPSRINC